MSFQLKQEGQTLPYGYFSSFSHLPIIHGMSTRLGGVSAVPYAQLNLGLHIGDEPVAVRRNRELFCEALCLDAATVTTAEQVHGVAVAVVDRSNMGKGALEYQDSIAGTDALITNVPGIPLMLFYADCVPLFIIDPVNQAIGLVHAGWKGTVDQIAVRTLESMSRHFNSIPSQCVVGIGPSIGPCCYQVDRTVADRWQKNFPKWPQLLSPLDPEHWMLNLWLSNRFQMEEAGVLPDNITVSSVCTACHYSHYFSYRAEQGQTGRHGAVMALKK